MKTWVVRGYMVGMCIVWVAGLSQPSDDVGFFLVDTDDSPYIRVMAETKSLAIRAAQEAWRTQTSYMGPSY